MRNHSIDSLINFYYLPNIDYTAGTLTGYGQAFNTPGNELFVAGYECIETEENIECYDLANTFIPIHELGHLATEEVGHIQVFWDNFKWLLKIATDHGLYDYVDYSLNV